MLSTCTNLKVLNGPGSVISPCVVFLKPCSSLHPGLLIIVTALVRDDCDVGRGGTSGQDAAVAG